MSDELAYQFKVSPKDIQEGYINNNFIFSTDLIDEKTNSIKPNSIQKAFREKLNLKDYKYLILFAH